MAAGAERETDGILRLGRPGEEEAGTSLCPGPHRRPRNGLVWCPVSLGELRLGEDGWSGNPPVGAGITKPRVSWEERESEGRGRYGQASGLGTPGPPTEDPGWRKEAGPRAGSP